MYLSIEPFGRLPDRRECVRYTLENARGSRVSCTDYGARITDIIVPDAAGEPDNVVLGFGGAEQYQRYGAYVGATCGRVAGRIGGGAFTLNKTEYALSKNEGKNTLHGGATGFDAVLWDVEYNAGGLTFRYVSPDGDMGFPGEAEVSVTFSLSDGDALSIVYEAVSDRDTLMNLTNHSYFNLDGRHAPSVLSHTLSIEADAFCPVDCALLPTGERRPVNGTPFDFTSPKALGRDIECPNEQLKQGNGYDHNFVLRGEAGTLHRAAVLESAASGRRMTVDTTTPGLQLYTANGLPLGGPFHCRSAVCLETQYFPNAVNVPGFLPPILRAGERMRQETVFQFGVCI